MSETTRVEHGITVAAPARAVYDLIADVTAWPEVFPPTVHVEREELSPSEERIRIWATANGQAKTWTSRRTLDSDTLRVEFRQEVSQPPVAAMGGVWQIEPIDAANSRVRLLHDYRAVDDDPANLAWIDEAVDRNSGSELEALRRKAESTADGTGTLLTFEDTVHIGGSAEDVYDFVNEAQLWSQRLPHVATVRLEEETPGLQLLEMDTRTKDGSVHTTKSVRVAFPWHKIVYKQIKVPALMTLHTGQWTFAPDGDGVAATSRHTVVINEANIETVLGAGADVAGAREYVRNALSTNSLATLDHARRYAESRR
jgi:aromatase